MAGGSGITRRSALVLAAGVAFVALITLGQASEVADVTSEELSTAIRAPGVTVVEFYDPWCHHCKAFERQYESAAAFMSRSSLEVGSLGAPTFVRIDCEAHPDVAEHYAVASFPTVLFFHGSHADHPVRYTGDLQAADLVAEVKTHVAQSRTGFTPGAPATVVLTKANFSQFTNTSPLTLVAYYAPWCGHCKKMLPILDAAARLCQELAHPVPVAKVDCVAQEDLCTDANVTRYPTLFMVRHGRRHPLEVQAPTEVELAQYVAAFSGPVSRRLTTDAEVARALSSHPQAPLAIFFGPSQHEKVQKGVVRLLRDGFFELAYGSRGEYVFADAPPALAESAGFRLSALESDGVGAAVVLVQQPQLRSGLESPYKVFDLASYLDSGLAGEGEADNNGDPAVDLAAAMQAEFLRLRHGLAGVMTRATAKHFEHAKPLVAVYYDIDYSNRGPKSRVSDAQSIAFKESVYWRRRVLEVAHDLQDITVPAGVRFACVNASEFPRHLDKLGLTDVEADVRVGIWAADGSKYRMVDEEDVASTEFSSEALSEFVEAFVAGTLEPYVRSQPVPRYEGDGNTGGRSRPIVAANFDDMVTSTGANAILMFHTPWCQHCVEFEPLWQELARQVSVLGVRAYSMDADRNDVPQQFELSGYPSVFFVPGVDAAAPVRFSLDGNRTVAALLDFVQQQLQSHPGPASVAEASVDAAGASTHQQQRRRKPSSKTKRRRKRRGKKRKKRATRA